MVAVKFAGFFRLDEDIIRRNKPVKKGHALSDWDAEGHPVCIEPDGKLHRKPATRVRR